MWLKNIKICLPLLTEFYRILFPLFFKSALMHTQHRTRAIVKQGHEESSVDVNFRAM